MQGGSIAIGASSSVKFQVTIDIDAQGIVENQAIINAGGENGAPPSNTVTDGNGGMPGSPPTEVLIEECADDSMCPGSKPICAVDLEPNICVQCLEDTDCGGLVPVCAVGTNICVCVPSGVEVCDGLDNDCNDQADEGFGVGEACSAGMGECAVMGVSVCDGQGAIGCDAVPNPSGAEVCGDDIDSDCDGNNDNGCVCVTDADCGASDSGQVCDAQVCIDGCRGQGGNGCPAGLICTSQDDTVGQCVPDSGTGSDSNSGESGNSGGMTSEPTTSASDTSPTETNSDANTDSSTDSDSDSTTAASNGEIDDEGLGCECDSKGAPAPLGLTLLVLAGMRRRRRQA